MIGYNYMNIDIPQPTVLQRLEADLKNAIRVEEGFRRKEEGSANHREAIGYRKGLAWAVENLQINE